MRASERVLAWVVTGPIGHLWSALADMTAIWARFLAHRVRRALGRRRPSRGGG